MDIEILAIGEELLTGRIANTNASIISKKLFSKGYRVTKHRVVKDSVDSIAATLQEIFVDSSLVICTGGLGPTIDDKTKMAMIAAFDLELELNPALLEKLTERFPGIPTLKNQATVIKGAHLITNPVGTAPGMIFTFSKGKVILLPGVPSELEAMLDEVLVYIEKAYPRTHCFNTQSINFVHTGEPEIDPLVRELKEKYPHVEFGIYPNLGTIHLQMIGDSKRELEEITKKILLDFPKRAFFSPNNTIEEAIHSLLLEKKQSLAFAESCSGGLLSTTFTKIPGCSSYFKGSIVCYSNELKQRLLGVEEATLKEKGAVSKETVGQMLEGLFKKTEADYGIAISGIAGPGGGTESCPVGTVFVAIGKKGKKMMIQKTVHNGDRKRVTQSATTLALSLLYQLIRNESF